MKRALCVVLMLAGKAWGCLPGEDCWIYEIGLTGYVIPEIEMNTQVGCDPLTFEMSQWYGERDGTSFNGMWLGGFVDPAWSVFTTRSEIYGAAPEDGSPAIVEYDYWLSRPDGQGGFLDPILGSVVLKPTTNKVEFFIDGCGYRLTDAPYSISGLQTMGDSNLDGVFDSGDLVTAFIAGKYELDINADWTEGDWSNDRRFDSNDFVFALTHGAYGDTAVAAVPEPSTLWLLAIGLLLQQRLSRRSNAAVKHVV